MNRTRSIATTRKALRRLISPAMLRLNVVLATILLLAGAAWGAEQIRFLREEVNRGFTNTDNELVATRLRWKQTDGAVRWVLHRDILSQTIIPSENNFFGLTLNEITQGMNRSLDIWNEVDADFTFSPGLIYSDFYAGIDPLLPNGPEEAGLDGYNFVSFQDFTIDIEAPTDDSFVLALTSVFYFNQDVDLSDTDSFPPFVISSNEFDAFIDLNNDNLFDLTIPRDEYKAGHLIDTDIIFNPSLTTWNLMPEDPSELTPEQREYESQFPDIEGTFTHELGHAAGLAHTFMQSPTMTPVASLEPYGERELDFDDMLSLRMNYPPNGGKYYFNRLGKGAISGRIINGDAVDNVPLIAPDVIPEVQNTPVFVGRPNNDGFTAPDDRVGIDETTSFTNKIRLFAEVMNSPTFRTPLVVGGAGLTAPIQRDNRYFIGGLPHSGNPVNVNDSLTLAPSNYVVYIEPAQGFTNDAAQVNFGADDFPTEFYGGTVPWYQPGLGDAPDANSPGDFRVQDNFLQAGYNGQGQFSLLVAGSTHQLIEESITPLEGYTTVRVIKDGVTTDVPNFDTANFRQISLLENDLANLVQITSVVGDSIMTTQTIQLGSFRSDVTTPTTMRVQMDLTNITTSTIEAGLRFLVRPRAGAATSLMFYVDEEVLDQEITLTGSQIPSKIMFGPNFGSQIEGVMVLKNPPAITQPDIVQLANWYNINQFGAPTPQYFTYETNSFDLVDPTYTVVFLPRTLAPGETVTLSTGVSYNRGPSYVDGPTPLVAGANGNPLPGGDRPDFYLPVPVAPNTITSGIDILTNTGTPGGLDSSTTDTQGDGSDPFGDEDEDDIINADDNCVFIPNTDQLDSDGDGIGDVCDQDFVNFTDISPSAGGFDRKDGVPAQSLFTFGATFGDINNDGYPDLALANGAVLGGSPESLVNRLYVNIPAPTLLEPGGRRFVDATFGLDGIPNTGDDRLPFDRDASIHINLADFDNDGDLDMYVSNFASDLTGGLIGAQNRFYENIDVDDPNVNPSPDADPVGDGFFRDVTGTAFGANQAWDPGILNVGAFTPYPFAIDVRTYGLSQPGFDISSHSDVGDLDGDGDLDVVVANQNTFLDLDGSFGINTRHEINNIPQPVSGGLRFSERILINHTRNPSLQLLPGPGGRNTRFADETLGADGLFGFEADRMPALKPNIPPRTPTDGLDEVDLSNTMQVVLSHFLFGHNALGINVFDQRNPESFGGLINSIGPWDGDDLHYGNLDLNSDGIHDGVFFLGNYGTESWLEAADGTPIKMGIPDGLPGDANSPEADRKDVRNDQSQAGLVFDWDYLGFNKMVSFNVGADFNVYGNNANSSGFGTPNRGRNVAGSPDVRDSNDYTTWRDFPPNLIPLLGGSPPFQSNVLTLPRTGRTRSGLTEDFNLDGLPDILVANDSNVTNLDVHMPNLPHGNMGMYINQDYQAFVTVHPSATISRTVARNERLAPYSWVTADDIDLDGDIDYFTGSYGNPGFLFRNDVTTAGVAATTPHNTVVQSPNRYDRPLFIDSTYEMLGSYYGTGADASILTGHNFANITLGTALADMDKDGDLDLVFSNGGIFTSEGEFQMLYKNNGKLVHSGEHVFTPASSPFAAPTLMQDTNNDPWLTDVPSRAFDVEFVDFTADGGPDIMFTNNGSSVRFFRNMDLNDNTRNSAVDTDIVPDGIFEERGDRVPTLSDARMLFSRKMAVGDIDKDGLPDVVVANGTQNEGAPNLILMNGFGVEGAGYFSDESSTRLPQFTYVDQFGNVTGTGPVLDDTADVALVDVDNDDDLDIIFANRAKNTPDDRLNLYEYCRLLLNDGNGFFTEVVGDAFYQARFSPAPIVAPSRWPMYGRFVDAQGILVGDLTNKGESAGTVYPPGGTEDVNGNGVLEDTEDLNASGALDFDDVGRLGSGAGNGRHDCNYDLIFLTADSDADNIILINQDVDDTGVNPAADADPFGDGFYSDQSTARLSGSRKFPTFGGDIGDVNNDGLLDIVYAVDTHTTDGSNQLFDAKIPVQLFINTAPPNEGGAAGFFVNETGTGGTDGETPSGELPVLKIQISQGHMAPVPGNSRSLKLADIDRDGDLDMIIGQTGRGESLPTRGFFNQVLTNMSIGANWSSRNVFSVRDPGGPILKSIIPGAAGQGQLVRVTITGKNFTGLSSVSVGEGITIWSQPFVTGSETLAFDIRIAEDAPIGPRSFKVVNPDGQYSESSSNWFQVLPASSVGNPSAARADWQMYE